MVKIPILKPREVVYRLEEMGFKEIRQRGSHKQYRHPVEGALQYLFIKGGIFRQSYCGK